MYRPYALFLGLAAVLPATYAYSQPNPDRLPLSGVVRDESGNPLPGASVTVRRQDDSGTFGFWGSEAVTDGRGQFRFPTAEEGRYYLNADKSGYAQRMNITVDWKRGAEPLKVDLARLADLKLRLLKPDGTPLTSSAAYLRSRGDGEGGQSYSKLSTDANGIAVLSQLVPDSYRFVVVAPGTGTGEIAKLPLAYSPETKVVDVPLQSGGSLHVRAVERSATGGPSRPLGGVTLLLSPSAIPDAAGNRMPSDPGDNTASLAVKLDRSGITTPDNDGNLVLNDLPVGRYSAIMMLPGWPRLPEQSVNIEAGKTAEAEWVFEPKASASLTLTVQDKNAAPWSNREILIRSQVLNPADGQATMDFIPGMQPFFPGSNLRRGTTDAQGKLTLYPLRPGKYRLWVAPRDASGNAGRGNAVDQEVNVPAEGGAATFKLQVPLPAP